jgi:16S rRNA (uracil1498-N3)-methyltransferase
MHLFYTPDISLPVYFLSEEESKHCTRVLRLKPKDRVQLIDGAGNLYHAEITDAHPKRTQLTIIDVQQEFGKRNHYLHIAIAPTKNIERFEWFLEKATEIGIDEITPIISHHSERKEVKIERLNKIITSAVKQSLKAYHPRLNEIVSFKNYVAYPYSGQKFIAHCEKLEKSFLKDVIELQGNYIILIGPEGDFSSSEINIALENGYQSITLGESRLRTETAALEACFEINFLNR